MLLFQAEMEPLKMYISASKSSPLKTTGIFSNPGLCTFVSYWHMSKDCHFPACFVSSIIITERSVAEVLLMPPSLCERFNGRIQL